MSEFEALKIRDENELAAVREFAAQHELDVAAVVPYDDSLPEAERAQKAPLDFAPDAPAIGAISEFARAVAT